jgi:hypothetical protein
MLEEDYLAMKKTKVERKILINFLELFNFDFEHTGYSKDMEKFGSAWFYEPTPSGPYVHILRTKKWPSIWQIIREEFFGA